MTGGQRHPAKEPDYAVRPGETLRAWIEETGQTPEGVAQRLGMPLARLDGLLTGLVPLNTVVASLLEAETGISASKWTALENDYRQARQRLRGLPVVEMVNGLTVGIAVALGGDWTARRDGTPVWLHSETEKRAVRVSHTRTGRIRLVPYYADPDEEDVYCRDPGDIYVVPGAIPSPEELAERIRRELLRDER